MNPYVSFIGSIFAFTGALGAVFLSINLLSPFFYEQMLSVYFALVAAFMFVFVFRIRRENNYKKTAWQCLMLSIMSMAIIFLGLKQAINIALIPFLISFSGGVVTIIYSLVKRKHHHLQHSPHSERKHLRENTKKSHHH